MISLQFILFVIPFIFGSLCEARMENDMKIYLERMEQRFNQQFYSLQQKHENSISHLQTQIASLKKENSVKDQRFHHEIHTLQQKHENSLSHLQTDIQNLQKENSALQSKLKHAVDKLEKQEYDNRLFETRLSMCENKLHHLYNIVETAKGNKLHENENMLQSIQNESIARYLSNESVNLKIHTANTIDDENKKEKDQKDENHKFNLLEKKITELQNQDVSLKQQIGELKQQQMEGEQKISVISEQLNTTLDQRSTFVSFTAYATVDRDYNTDDIVLFDGIVSNYGGYYNQTKSIFMCPHSGYYLISVNILADYGYQMAVDLRIDGDHVVGAYARDSDYRDQGSLTAVQLCQQGAAVWVRCRADGDRMHGDGSGFSSFTATLLRIV